MRIRLFRVGPGSVCLGLDPDPFAFGWMRIRLFRVGPGSVCLGLDQDPFV